MCTLATQIKTGALCRTHRVAESSRLLLIEAKLDAQAVYRGQLAFAVQS